MAARPRQQALGPQPPASQALGSEQQAPRVALRWSAPFEALDLGQRFQSEPRTVTESDVSVFCALTGDWHPQHWDAEWASRSAFGQRIAHGMLVLSLAVGLVPFDPERVRALRRVGDAVFKRPVRLGEQISLTGEIAGLRPVDERAGLVDLGLAIRNGELALVCRASVQVLWAGGAGAGPPRAATGIDVGARAAAGMDAAAGGATLAYWERAVPDLAETFTPLPL